MNRILNWLIALLLPSMVACSAGKKVQEVPEEIYACPMPTDPVEDEPEVEDVPEVELDTTNNIKTNK